MLLLENVDTLLATACRFVFLVPTLLRSELFKLLGICAAVLLESNVRDIRSSRALGDRTRDFGEKVPCLVLCNMKLSRCDGLSRPLSTYLGEKVAAESFSSIFENF